MKKVYVAIIAMVVMMMASQPALAQFRWGATAGATLTNLNFKQDLFTVDKLMGASAGVKGEMMFPGIGFGIEFGLLYEMRGAKLHMGERLIWASQGYGTETTRLHYIDIPFHLKFKWTRMNGIEDYVAPFVQGGPTFNILAGHTKNDAIKFANGGLGLTCGGGVELFKCWQVGAFYTWGMTYALKTRQLTDFSARNSTWDFRITYFFNRD